MRKIWSGLTQEGSHQHSQMSSDKNLQDNLDKKKFYFYHKIADLQNGTPCLLTKQNNPGMTSYILFCYKIYAHHIYIW